MKVQQEIAVGLSDQDANPVQVVATRGMGAARVSGWWVAIAAFMLVGAAYANEALDYDARGNIKSRRVDGQLVPSTYKVDEVDRIREETGKAAQVIVYDANGNRIQDGGGTYSIFPNTNQINQRYGVSVIYDSNGAGNVVSEQAVVGGVTVTRGYVYNPHNQLETLQINGVIRAVYSYNYMRQRVRKYDFGPVTSITLYRYDPQGHMIEEVDGLAGSPTRGRVLVSYVWKGDAPTAVIFASGTPSNPNGTAEKIVYLETDHLNTPRKGTDSGGNVVWTWESDAFGVSAPNEDPDGDGVPITINLRFEGQYFDAESGLHYNMNRYYDPKIGRYTQSDPIGVMGGSNTYAYVGAAPLGRTDPSGLAQILGRPSGFHEGIAWAKKYRELIVVNEEMRQRIKKICKKAEQEKLLEIFDNWKIQIDPNIDNMLTRARGDYAVTKYSSQMSQFNFAFFNREPMDPSSASIFMHEFRHLMKANNALAGVSDLGAVLAGRETDARYEIDANAWSEKFLSGVCSCDQ